MKKVVVTLCYGGFFLSKRAKDLYLLKSGKEKIDSFYDIERDDPFLIEIIEELRPSDIGIALIPDNIEFEIQSYDGWESVIEKGRIWYGEDWDSKKKAK